MRQTTALLILFAAAVLEAGGDALMRSGMHASVSSARLLFWLTGALVLFTYGYVVNAPPWDFGRLLGIYVVFFFGVTLTPRSPRWGGPCAAPVRIAAHGPAEIRRRSPDPRTRDRRAC